MIQQIGFFFLFGLCLLRKPTAVDLHWIQEYVNFKVKFFIFLPFFNVIFLFVLKYLLQKYTC